MSGVERKARARERERGRKRERERKRERVGYIGFFGTGIASRCPP